MQSTANPLVDFSTVVGARRKFDLDLSRSTLIEVLEAYAEFKRKVHPNFNNKSIIGNLRIIEVMAGAVLMPEDVTDDFYSTMSAWLTSRGVKYSSQDNYTAHIRAALNWAIRHRCPVSSTYDQIDIPKYQAFTIALTPDEVSHIAHFDLNTVSIRPQYRRTLERVRDHFVLSCQLGQRYSDMVRITKENFNRNLFTCVQQKTGQKCVVDIDRFAMHPALTYRLLEKYGGAPYTKEITNYDKYLKKLLFMIGEEFLEEYKVEHKVEGKIQTTIKKKYELVASHTARRTFATFNSFRQVPLAELMRATGHKSLGCFAKYIKYGD